MDAVNRTLYIPLYGKAYVSKKGLFLKDPKAEEIWAEEGFALRGKAASKWLAYYMGIRSAVFDQWLRKQLDAAPRAVVLHLGCGLDSRVLRVAAQQNWYDVDFPEVIRERERYYQSTEHYRMISGDVRDSAWLREIPEDRHAIVVMEGLSMYLTTEELQHLLAALGGHFRQVSLLTDCYSDLAARLSRYSNPVSELGVTRVYGLDDPGALAQGGFEYLQEHTMIPQRYIDRLRGAEKQIFRRLYAGRLSQKLYRLYEYRKIETEKESTV